MIYIYTGKTKIQVPVLWNRNWNHNFFKSRNRNRNHNFSNVGTGTVKNSYGSTTLPATLKRRGSWVYLCIYVCCRA